MKTLLIGLTLAFLTTPALAQDAPPPLRGGGMMMRADANGDGTISRDEAIAQATDRFDRLDLDHDGKLTRDELGKAAYGIGGRRGDISPPPPAPAPR